LTWVPYSMQLAHGWTKLSFYINFTAIFIFVPVLVLGIYWYGAIGGVLSWVFLNFTYFVIYIWLMHRRILKGEMFRWYWQDVGIIIFAVLPIVFLGKLYLPVTLSRIETIAAIGTVSFFAFIAAFLSSFYIRKRFFQYILPKAA
jgi:hypothetical protein